MTGCHVPPDQQWNLIFGYNNVYREVGQDLNPDAGTIAKSLGVVPAGQIWVVQNFGVSNEMRALTHLLNIWDGTNYYPLLEATQSGTGYWVCWNGAVVLYPGECLRVFFRSTVAGDNLYWSARGYKMVLTQ